MFILIREGYNNYEDSIEVRDIAVSESRERLMKYANKLAVHNLSDKFHIIKKDEQNSKISFTLESEYGDYQLITFKVEEIINIDEKSEE